MRISPFRRKLREHNIQNRRVSFPDRKKVAFCKRSHPIIRFKKRNTACYPVAPMLNSSYFDKAKIAVYMVILTIYNYFSKFLNLSGSKGHQKISYRTNDKLTYSANLHGFVFNKYVYLSKLGGLIFTTGMSSEQSGSNSPDENEWIRNMVSLIASPDTSTRTEPEVG